MEGSMGEGKGSEALRGLRHQRTSGPLTSITWSSRRASAGQHAQGLQKFVVLLTMEAFKSSAEFSKGG